MDETLRSVLCCPACRGHRGLSQTELGLRCGDCGKDFPVVRGRPVLTTFGATDPASLASLLEAAAKVPEKAPPPPAPRLAPEEIEPFYFGKLFPRLNRKDPHWAFLGRKVREMVAEIPQNASVLDVGAGECRYRALLPGRAYVGADLVFSSDRHDFSQLDVVADATNLPFCDQGFDAMLNLVVMEHVPDPEQTVREMHRVLKPGGQVFALIPLVRPEHLAPFDFHRFTRYGIQRLFETSGFEIQSIESSNGGFWTAIHYLRQYAQTQPLQRHGRRSILGMGLNRLWAALLWPFVAYGRASDARYGDEFPVYFWVRARARADG